MARRRPPLRSLLMMGSADFAPVFQANFLALSADTTPSWIDNSGTTGNRMVTDSTGALTWAPANLLLQSQFASGWTAVNSTLTANTTVAPDGTTTAATLNDGSAASAAHGQYENTNVVSPGYFICSVYAKQGTGRYITVVNVDSGTNGGYATFDLTNGAVTQSGSLGTGTLLAAVGVASTNGFYRLSVAANLPVGGFGIFGPYAASAGTYSPDTFGRNAYTGGSNTWFVWGAQLERVTYQTSPRAYIPTTTAAVYQPRYDYDGSTVPATPKGMLIEESRTNLLTYSEQFDNDAWIKSLAGTGTAAVVTANQAISPDGTQSADLVVFNAGSNSAGDYSLLQGSSFAASAQPYTFSVWLKTSDGTTKTAQLSISGAGAKTVTVTSAWQRFDTTWSASAGAWNPRILIGQSITSATASFFVFGAQVEAGSFATSYIPTTSGAVTRVADVVKWTSAAFSSYWNASNGTVAIEANIPSTVSGVSGNYYFAASDGTLNNTILEAKVGSNIVGQITASGTNTYNNSIAYTATSRILLAYAANNSNMAVNGTAGTTDTSVTIPTVSKVNIGLRGDNFSLTTINGYVRSFAYYNQRLPNAILKQKSIVGAPY